LDFATQSIELYKGLYCGLQIAVVYLKHTGRNNNRYRHLLYSYMLHQVDF